jgi:hypothetical protein
VSGKKVLSRLASGFIFLLANPEFYSHLASWREVIRTPAYTSVRTLSTFFTTFISVIVIMSTSLLSSLFIVVVIIISIAIIIIIIIVIIIILIIIIIIIVIVVTIALSPSLSLSSLSSSSIFNPHHHNFVL